ncbi:nucleotidyltransferase domain-containing protein [Candidatus Woesearchaeota archaeon]|nr:nucleotidyltransferase domain-containing protein [Candidatus Woesearchaeota archaeon]
MNKYDFVINNIKKKYKNDERILKILIYGSVARGDFSERHSDLDLFIVLNNEEPNKKITKKLIFELEKIAIKYSVKIHAEFQGKSTTTEDHTLLQKLLIEGKIIVDNYNKLIFNTNAFGLKPYYVFEYNAYKSKKRTLFSKLLHGKKVNYLKNGKKLIINYKGIADNKNIIILGRNVLMIIAGFEAEIRRIFKNFDVEYNFKGIVFK